MILSFKNRCKTFLFGIAILLFQSDTYAQYTISNNEFPVAGTNYQHSIAVTSSDTIVNAGPNRSFVFNNLNQITNDTLSYYDPALTGFGPMHPSATVASITSETILSYWFYDGDGNAFWKTGLTLVGNFGSGWDTASANYLPGNTDTLLSTDYTYGHSEIEISKLTLTLSAGLEYKIFRRRSVLVDSWGSLQTTLNNWNDVLRVKYMEYRYDTVFLLGLPIDNGGDTVYYFKYYAKDIRHPVVIANTNSADSILYLEYLYIPPIVLGCTDPLATNYNPLANTEDSSCIYCNTINYTITPDTFVCEGNSIALTVSGGISQLWSTGDSTTSIIVTPDSNTVYSVYLNDTAGCWNLATVEVKLYKPVMASFWTAAPSYYKGDTVIFVNGSTEATDYNWQFDDIVNNTSNAEIGTHVYATTGVKDVQLEASNGCYADSFIRRITILAPVGIDMVQKPARKVQLYPNPASTYLILNYHVPSHEEVSIFIVDVFGRSINIFSGDQNEGDHSYRIENEIEQLPAGIYFIEVRFFDPLLNSERVIHKSWAKLH